MFIKQLQTGCLAHFAYYIESEGQAVIVDPLRESEPYLELLKERGAQLTHVLETHFHADFVSGHLDLANKTGAKIVFGEKAKPNYQAYLAQNHEKIQLGKLIIEVLPTPGHTVESVSYLLYDEEGNKHAVFTGDAVFVGDVGRPDLASGNMSQEELASLLYDTIQNQFKTLPDNVLIYPAHGQGSACGKNLGPETFSTIGEQKQSNYAFKDMSREAFIQEVTEGLETPPSYFFKDAAINIQGYEPIDEVMKNNTRALPTEEFDTLRKQDGVIVLDTRDVQEFEKSHIPMAWNISLKGNYAPWVGALVPFGSKILLVTEPGKQEEAVLRLARVGYENVLGYLDGGMNAWESSQQEVEKVVGVESSVVPQLIADLKPTILDVRTRQEFSNGHYDNAKNIPLTELPEAINSLDPDQQYVVHCAGGYRSMVASSLLQSKGFKNIINVKDGYPKQVCMRKA